MMFNLYQVVISWFLVVISKLLGQSILGMRQLPRMNILVFEKRLVASSKSIIREKVNIILQELLTIPKHLSLFPVCSLFVLLSFFFWPLIFLFFFDLRILITPLVSANSSCSSEYQFQWFAVHNVDIRDVFPTPLKWKTNNTYIHHALKKQWEFKNMHRDMNEILCFVLIQITETGIQNYKKSLQIPKG
jgi:hypothetical protein